MRFLKNISNNQLADEELAAAYRSNRDTRLVSMLLQRYIDYLFGVCLKYLEDPEAARDAVMDIYGVLCEKLAVHQVDYFRGWLHVVARNHCLMQLRAQKKQPPAQASPIVFMQNGEWPHPETEWLEKEQQLQLLEDCLEQLSEEQKTSITLFYLQKKCYQEIVTLTGYDWNKVRSHIQNGRRNLKQCMENKKNDNDA